MQALSGTVGNGGANAKHNAALVQAMLVQAKRPSTLDPLQPKYLGIIDGDFGKKSTAALRQFQSDQVFVSADGRKSVAVAGAKDGIVAHGDPTWLKLLAAMPPDFADMRVLTGSKTVYLSGTTTARDVAHSLAGLIFEVMFRSSVVALINQIYDDTGIVVSACVKGDRRTFQTQYDLLTSGRNVTNAGPGESNHNFGKAVDLGFAGLRWLRSNGTEEKNEDSWMHKLDPKQTCTGESLFFWDMLRNAGTAAGLFRGPLKDRPHLQAWSDAGIDMATRLAALLTTSGSMRWTGRAKRYQCDLGYGGRFFEVGSAAQIWNRQATVTAADLTQARAQLTAASLAQRAGPVIPAAHLAGADARARPAPRPPVTQVDVTAMKAALRADFDASDLNWPAWRPR